jgi:hypothetical protein
MGNLFKEIMALSFLDLDKNQHLDAENSEEAT